MLILRSHAFPISSDQCSHILGSPSDLNLSHRPIDLILVPSSNPHILGSPSALYLSHRPNDLISGSTSVNRGVVGQDPGASVETAFSRGSFSDRPHDRDLFGHRVTLDDDAR